MNEYDYEEYELIASLGMDAGRFSELMEEASVDYEERFELSEVENSKGFSL